MWPQVADRLKRQYLSEMMSTRLGVKRAAAVKSAAKRQGSDGKEYYDIQVGLLAKHTGGNGWGHWVDAEPGYRVGCRHT